MAWQGGFKGDAYDRTSFRNYLKTQPKPSFADKIVIHATGAPYTLASVGGPQRIRNLGNYYKNDKGWKGGPNTFVMEGLVYPGSPMNVPSVNSPSWNNTSIATEVEGTYAPGKHSPTSGQGKIAWDTAAWQTAEIMEWMGWPIDAKHIKLHREDPKTTHKVCPSPPGLITSDWFIKKVLAASGQAVPSTLPEPKPATQYYVTNTPGDTLNFRDAPNGKIKSVLPNGTKVILLKEDGVWSYVQTPLGFKGWVFDKYLVDPVIKPLPPVPDKPKPAEPQPEVPVEKAFEPGTFRLSEYGHDWLKKFEGLGPINKNTGLTEAYWDINDYAIGHGHNNGSGIPPKVKKGDAITIAEADRILRENDVPPVEHYLNSYVKVPLTQPQIDALIWHIYQQGPGNFRNGKVLPYVNAKMHKEAADTIEHWPTSNKGLQRRRGVEATRYRGGKPTKW